MWIDASRTNATAPVRHKRTGRLDDDCVILAIYKPSDNPSRLERSRKAALDAAITIVTRDGSGCLTPDAIARESGLSKGGVMHQLRIKEAVRRASSRTADDAFRGVLEPLPREGAHAAKSASARKRSRTSRPGKRNAVQAEYDRLAALDRHRAPEIPRQSVRYHKRYLGFVTARGRHSRGRPDRLPPARLSPAFRPPNFLTSFPAMAQLYKPPGDKEWAALPAQAKAKSAAK